MLKQDPEAARAKADLVIKNTYRTLLTRGMKGCFVYFIDDETAHFFRSRLAKAGSSFSGDSASSAVSDPVRYSTE